MKLEIIIKVDGEEHHIYATENFSLEVKELGEETEARKWNCRICPKEFEHLHELVDHINKEHLGWG